MIHFIHYSLCTPLGSVQTSLGCAALRVCSVELVRCPQNPRRAKSRRSAQKTSPILGRRSGAKISCEQTWNLRKMYPLCKRKIAQQNETKGKKGKERSCTQTKASWKKNTLTVTRFHCIICMDAHWCIFHWSFIQQTAKALRLPGQAGGTA